MARWRNPPAVVFHGTDTAALTQFDVRAGSQLAGFEVSLAQCRPDSDFGRGFYVTTNEQQAREWANTRVRQSKSSVRPLRGVRAVVLVFKLDLTNLARLDALCFVRPTDHYFAFVDECRLKQNLHNRKGSSKAYDIVYGPVRMWPQRLVIQDGDQWGFHTEAAIAILPVPTALDVAAHASGLL
jgi:Protein of unknown function (DUF3990)